MDPILAIGRECLEAWIIQRWFLVCCVIQRSLYHPICYFVKLTEDCPESSLSKLSLWFLSTRVNLRSRYSCQIRSVWRLHGAATARRGWSCR